MCGKRETAALQHYAAKCVKADLRNRAVGSHLFLNKLSRNWPFSACAKFAASRAWLLQIS